MAAAAAAMTAATMTAVMTAMTAAAAVVAATTLMTLTTTGTPGMTTRRMPAGRGGGWRRGGRGSRWQWRWRQWRGHLWNSLAIEKDAEARLPHPTTWRRLVVPSRMIATVPVVPPCRWHVAIADGEVVFIVVVVDQRGQ